MLVLTSDIGAILLLVESHQVIYIGHDFFAENMTVAAAPTTPRVTTPPVASIHLSWHQHTSHSFTTLTAKSLQIPQHHYTSRHITRIPTASKHLLWHHYSHRLRDYTFSGMQLMIRANDNDLVSDCGLVSDHCLVKDFGWSVSLVY